MENYWSKTTSKLKEDLPYFSAKTAEVLKEYKFQFLSHRELDESDKFYNPEMLKFEITMLDANSGREKVWTVNPSLIRRFESEGIVPNDYFIAMRTGDLGADFWKIKKINPVQV